VNKHGKFTHIRIIVESMWRMQDFYALHLAVNSTCEIYLMHLAVHSTSKISTSCTLDYTAHGRFLPVASCSTQCMIDFYLMQAAVCGTCTFSTCCTLQYSIQRIRDFYLLHFAVHSACKIYLMHLAVHSTCKISTFCTLEYTAHAIFLPVASCNHGEEKNFCPESGHICCQ
jgi:hypothetical protein